MVYSGSAVTSDTWTGLPSGHRAPKHCPTARHDRDARAYARRIRARSHSLRRKDRRLLLDDEWQRCPPRTAEPLISTSVSSTACKSKVERLMTLSTSAVAVCCASDSLQVLGARLHLLEQPHVADGDHRLVGESLEQLHLAVGIKPRHFAPHEISFRSPARRGSSARRGRRGSRPCGRRPWYRTWDRRGRRPHGRRPAARTVREVIVSLIQAHGINAPHGLDPFAAHAMN